MAIVKRIPKVGDDNSFDKNPICAIMTNSSIFDYNSLDDLFKENNKFFSTDKDFIILSETENNIFKTNGTREFKILTSNDIGYISIMENSGFAILDEKAKIKSAKIKAKKEEKSLIRILHCKNSETYEWETFYIDQKNTVDQFFGNVFFDIFKLNETYEYMFIKYTQFVAKNTSGDSIVISFEEDYFEFEQINC